ncbi:hypothetical protein C8A01DRAFT_48394 [Parachaetomium inaequale]|uniref:Uncharacterized protein n=1 Tax=Parachaetomium inaequale TaxID=2588326 RepID=A0AAN6SPK9_9PEZI|nr:hypothetical protein C8A01DRAFT_48394 [Parachaetomium inaequale]
MAQKGQAIARLQHSYALSPIAALAFHDAGPDRVLLLAGEDTWLKVYDVQTSRLLGQLKVFYSQPIHGIHVSQPDANEQTQLLIWGGHSVTLLPHPSLQALITGVQTPPPQPTESHAPDWIYDGILFPSTSNHEATGALITAHNEILPFSTQTPTNNQTTAHPLTFGPLTSPSRPILYSADLCLLSPDTVVVGLDGARETGFGGGENSEVRRENRGDAARCVAVAMGHVSRIWHVKFGRLLSGSGPVEIYSFGEDCSRQRWELDLDPGRWRGVKSGAEGRVGTLRQCGASTCHSGKNIWSAAVLGRGDNEPLVATGGADGKIVISGKIRDTSPGSGRYEDLDLSLTFDEVLQSLQGSTTSTPPAKKNTKQTFQRYVFLSDTVMAATASGRLFLATMGDPLAWEEVAVPEAIVADLRSYNVLRSPARDAAVIGSASGKISDIILLGTRLVDEQPWSVIINVLGLDHATLLHFDPPTNTSTLDPRKIRLPEHYIATAAAFCNDTLILGSRTGSLTVYTTDPETGDFTPLTSRKDCKTKDAITCIVPIPGTPANQPSFLTTCRDGKYRIYTLPATPSSAGLKLQHEISPPLNTLEAAFFTTPSPSQPLAQDPSVSRGIPKSHLILHGFHGPNFLTYNDSTRSILSSIPCGGAHRPFATTSCPHDPGQMRFVFSKGGELRVVSQSAVGERVLRAGGHGREVKSLGSSYFFGCSTGTEREDSDRKRIGEGEGVLVATAAEDTSIRIWRHHPSPSPGANPPEMTCLAIVQGHSAGIQTLRFFFSSPGLGGSSRSGDGDGYLLSSAGSEELFVWRISRVDSAAYDALAVVREAVWDDQTPDKDLRIVDFDVAGWDTTREQGTREGEGEGEGGMVITMGLSDSSVRSYIYSPPRAGSESGSAFKLLASGRYTGACPTQVRHLRVDAATGAVHVLTAFTDGHVAVWRRTEGAGEGAGEFGLALVVRLHQSSIKSLDLSAAEGPGRWLVATGGDDNALGFLDLVWDGDKGEYVVRGRYRVKDAHAAAVTGLSVVKAAPGMIDIATASNDQRVKLWRAKRSASRGMRVTMLDNRYSSVADAGDLELIAPGKIMVGGVGMEVWDVSGGSIEEG